MMRRTLPVLALLSCGEPLHAQAVDFEPADSARSAAHFELLWGLGMGGNGLALAHGPVLHTASGLFAVRINVMGALIGAGRSLGDVSLLYGVGHASGDVWMTAAAGPAMAWRVQRSCARGSTSGFGFCQRYRSESAGAVGLVLQGIVGVGPLSLGLHSNLNRLERFHAVTVNFHMGWRRAD